ncbi:UpxY family transcription antiterminator [Pedobacter panaciterrae]
MENLSTIRTNMPRRWYVIYTRPRWEKKVDELLKLQGITSYCPVRKVKNKWADRIKEVELPLFNSYVFVYIDPREELKVRVTLGVMNFVYYMGKPRHRLEKVL